MHLHYGDDVYFGVVHPTTSVEPEGIAVQIGMFNPSALVVGDPRPLGRWLMYEICDYLASEHPEVAAIGFSLARPMDLLGAPAEQALARVAALERIGARDITVVPRSHLRFLICGVWTPTRANIAALREALNEQRELFADLAVATPPKAGRTLLDRSKTLLARIKAYLA
ncbi:hypothetical protein ACSFA0_26440 [Variovorax sp. LT1P1]|uniref:hypothetical protein n=1 Tax=Variovorax sp. LT1P1 TaxID=3443730 RepID=UPI003F447AE3